MSSNPFGNIGDDYAASRRESVRDAVVAAVCYAIVAFILQGVGGMVGVTAAGVGVTVLSLAAIPVYRAWFVSGYTGRATRPAAETQRLVEEFREELGVEGITVYVSIDVTGAVTVNRPVDDNVIVLGTRVSAEAACDGEWREEAEAVIAHEVAHTTQRAETGLTANFGYPLLGAAALTHATTPSATVAAVGGAVTALAYWAVVGYLSRRKEFNADDKAARLTSRRAVWNIFASDESVTPDSSRELGTLFAHEPLPARRAARMEANNRIEHIDGTPVD